MSYQNDSQMSRAYSFGMDPIAAAAAVDQRITFIRKTYLHLVGAIFAFVLLETLLFTLAPGLVEKSVMLMAGSQFGWLIVFGAFMGVSYLADSWARSDQSVGMQYTGLGLYVVAEAIFLAPLLYLADKTAGGGVITSAALVTLVIFGGLSGVVFITKTDFSFLRYALYILGIAAFAAIAVSIFLPGVLGAWFPYAMVVFACLYILYDTSNVLHHYRTNQHVAASLALFASVALLFFYILRIFMSRD